MIDLVGKSFGKLVVLKESDRKISGKSLLRCWLCRCECGKEKIVFQAALTSGGTRSCGCSQLQRPQMDLTGKIFGRLIVIKEEEKGNFNQRRWLCKCICNNYKTILQYCLTTGQTLSCGCLAIESARKLLTKHGNSYTRAYRTWRRTLSRCFNPLNNRYQHYGGRGITVDIRWLNFDNFLNDMGDPPEKKSLDRIDNNLGYSKENCRWATSIEQCRNRSVTRKLTYKNEIKPLSTWAEIFNLSSVTIMNRINKLGWSIEDALEIKVREKKRKFKYGN